MHVMNQLINAGLYKLKNQRLVPSSLVNAFDRWQISQQLLFPTNPNQPCVSPVIALVSHMT